MLVRFCDGVVFCSSESMLKTSKKSKGSILQRLFFQIMCLKPWGRRQKKSRFLLKISERSDTREKSLSLFVSSLVISMAIRPSPMIVSQSG